MSVSEVSVKQTQSCQANPIKELPLIERITIEVAIRNFECITTFSAGCWPITDLQTMSISVDKRWFAGWKGIECHIEPFKATFLKLEKLFKEKKTEENDYRERVRQGYEKSLDGLGNIGLSVIKYEPLFKEINQVKKSWEAQKDLIESKPGSLQYQLGIAKSKLKKTDPNKKQPTVLSEIAKFNKKKLKKVQKQKKTFEKSKLEQALERSPQYIRASRSFSTRGDQAVITGDNTWNNGTLTLAEKIKASMNKV